MPKQLDTEIPSQNKNVRLDIRLSELDKNNLKTAASRLSLTVSEYVRFCSRLPVSIQNSVLKDPNCTVLIDTHTIKMLEFNLHKVGVNINQIAHAMNLIKLTLDNGNAPFAQKIALKAAVDTEKTYVEVVSKLVDVEKTLQTLVGLKRSGKFSAIEIKKV